MQHPRRTSPKATAVQWPRFLIGLSAIALATMGCWQLFKPIPPARPLPTSGGTSGELIDLDALAGATNLKAYRHRQVQFVGTLQRDHTVLLQDREMGGKRGFYVLAPLLLSGPSGLAIMVQRGWIPASTANPASKVAKFTPAHSLVIHGRLAFPDLGEPAVAAAASGSIRPALDLQRFAAERHLKLVPMVVLAEPEMRTSVADVRRDFFQRRWPELYPGTP